MQKLTLQMIRKQHNVSTEKMGEIIGTSGATYLRYEKNPQLLNVGQVWQLCQYFHIAVQDLELFENL